MSRREHADVDVVDPIAAHRAHIAELQHAQQLGLQAEGHVADLVEQQRAAVGLGEETLPGLNRAREAPLRVAEDLALEQLVGNGGRVDCDERPGRPRAARMDRSRDELLANARLAGDEDGGGGACDEVDLGLQHAHGRPISDEGHVGRARSRLGQADALDGVLPRVDGAGDDGLELGEIERLDRVAERAALDGVDGLVHPAGCGDHDHGKGGMTHLEPIEQLEPIHAIHAHVAHHRVERLPVHELESRSRARGHFADMTIAREKGAQSLAHVAVVVDDEEAGLHRDHQT